MIRMWKRWRKQRNCFHHDHTTGKSWIVGRLVEFGRSKHFMCIKCKRYWT